MQARIAQQHLSLARCHEGTHGFERIKRFACSRYADVHQARLRHFLPMQMLLSDGSRWLASCGLKVADTRPLFLEQYLDLPIVQTLSRIAGTPVGRQQIVEVGNLAGEPGSGRLMILSLTRYLAHSGIDYVVFTATRELQHAFARLGLTTWYMTDASPQRLSEGADDWGHYYHHKPAVFAGSVALGWQSVQQQPLLMRLLRSIDAEVADAV
jgi:hypothetical protein